MASAIDDMSAASSADEDGMDDDGFSNFSSGTSDDTSFPDSLSFSPTPRNSSVPVTNKSRRSRSFKLDLSAQRVLLQDSQKLNQAFKRCLVRTDELIAEGKRALQYQVNTGDVAHLGPRVLTPDERGEELQLGRGLLSPGLEEKTEMPWERTRSVGNTWSDLQPGSSEGLRLDIPADGDQGGIGDGEEPDTLESETKDILEAIYQDVPLPSDEVSLHEPRTPDKLDIPYIDPGIDTGGETPSAELDSETHKEDNSTPPHETSSSSASTEAEESTISSPGKGLGDFLRMVGGSWGV